MMSLEEHEGPTALLESVVEEIVSLLDGVKKALIRTDGLEKRKLFQLE